MKSLEEELEDAAARRRKTTAAPAAPAVPVDSEFARALALVAGDVAACVVGLEAAEVKGPLVMDAFGWEVTFKRKP